MSGTKQRGGISLVFQLLLCCIFVFCLLSVLLTGTEVYKSVSSLSQDGYDGRTCLAYIEAKLRSADGAGSLRVGDFDGHSAVFITEVYDDTEYTTTIYYYEDQVYELFTLSDVELGPEAGEPIIEAESLSFSHENGVITVTCGDKNIFYSPRSREVSE